MVLTPPMELQVKTIFLPTEKQMTSEACAPLIATLPLEVKIFMAILSCFELLLCHMDGRYSTKSIIII